ncbi:hypothetical protein [Synechocystis salina]|uniref:Uncharacterized protein n=1 Tax=Synechocystis salina LEGE 00031 TaxID=1828736 RepID=A0ABR9VPB6_9SYNC|nr:hypothetical protein [Synechocystis salina]MBE9239958.1 hypothetical protein [Synechocystis salina LEGE 00041]MBE9253159.1 hypothetical protein [Synechocystis salina LEGE 00031]
MKNTKARTLLNKGFSITGASIGSALGFLAGGPAGAAAAGALGVVIDQTLSEVASRLLSEREQSRIGATAQSAIVKIETLKKEGRKVREDGFFDGDRSSAEEVFEGCLLASKNSHEEKKAIYLGNLFASICFSIEIDKHQANRLISIANGLTYSQLCLLNIFKNKNKYRLKDTNFREAKLTFKHVVIIQEIYALDRDGIIIFEGQHVFGITDVKPNVARVQGIGFALYDLMDLASIPDTELAELVSFISV